MTHVHCVTALLWCFCMLIASIRMYFDLACPVWIYLIDGMNKEWECTQWDTLELLSSDHAPALETSEELFKALREHSGRLCRCGTWRSRIHVPTFRRNLLPPSSVQKNFGTKFHQNSCNDYHAEMTEHKCFFLIIHPDCKTCGNGVLSTNTCFMFFGPFVPDTIRSGKHSASCGQMRLRIEAKFPSLSLCPRIPPPPPIPLL
jgi:hypothetical protein